LKTGTNPYTPDHNRPTYISKECGLWLRGLVRGSGWSTLYRA